MPKPELRSSIVNLEEQLKQLIMRVEQSESDIKQVWRNRLDRTLKCLKEGKLSSLIKEAATQTETFAENDSNISEQLVLQPRQAESVNHDEDVQLHSPVPSITSAVGKSPIRKEARVQNAKKEEDNIWPKSSISLVYEHHQKYQPTSKAAPGLRKISKSEIPASLQVSSLEIPPPTQPGLLVGQIVRQNRSKSRSVSPATPSVRIKLSKEAQAAAVMPKPQVTQIQKQSVIPAATRVHTVQDVKPPSAVVNQLSLTPDESSKLKHLVTAKFFSQRKRSDGSDLRCTRTETMAANSTFVKDLWDNSWVSGEVSNMNTVLMTGASGFNNQKNKLQEGGIRAQPRMDLKKITTFDLLGHSPNMSRNPFSTKRHSEQVNCTAIRQSLEMSQMTSMKMTEAEGFIQKYKNSWKDENLFNPALDFLYDFTGSGQFQNASNSQMKTLRLELEECSFQDQSKVNEVVAIIKRILDGKKPTPVIISSDYLESSRRSSINRTVIAEGVRTLLKYAQLCWLSNKELLALISPIRYLPDNFLIEKLNDENRRLKNFYEMHQKLFIAYGERAKHKMRSFAACQQHSDVLLPNPKMYTLLTAEESYKLHETNNLILDYCKSLKAKSMPVPSFRGFSIEELIEIDTWESRSLASPKSQSRRDTTDAIKPLAHHEWRSSMHSSSVSNSGWPN